jgi:MFS family permease
LEKQTIPSPNTQKKQRMYYGYAILATCFFIMTLVSGAQASFGVFFKPMLNEFGWTRASTSLPFSLNLILCGVFGILAGRISDRIGPKSVVTIGGIVLGAGYMLMSRINNLWGLYLSYGILVALGSAAFYVPLVATVTRWFPKKRGMMVGIGVSGIGFGIGIVPTIASKLMVEYNWRTSLFIVGAASLVLIALLGQLLKSDPGNMPEDKPSDTKTVSSLPSIGMSFNEAVKTKQFWMIFVAWLLYGFFFQVGAVHTVPYATDLGMTALAAATLLSIIGLIGIAGRSSLGIIGDKFNNKVTLAASFILISLVFFTIAFSGTIEALYAYAVVYGLFSGVGVLLASINAEHFGLQALGAITGAIVFGNNIGGALGPALAGFIFDATDSYKLAFLLCGVAAVAAGIFVWLLKPSAKTQTISK